jgi:peptidoglycan hydrolase CwlO-like protein
MLKYRSIVEGLFQEMTDMISHLDVISRRVEAAPTLLDKVRLKIEWMEVKTNFVQHLQDKISHLQNHLDEENRLHEIKRQQGQLYRLTLQMISENFVRESSSSPGRLSEWLIDRSP